MARLLNTTGYFASILAAVCLILALVAAPIGQARADDPPPGGVGEEPAIPVCAPDVTTCGTNTGTIESECFPIKCNQNSQCHCRWKPAGAPSTYACRCVTTLLGGE